ncbi:MAG: hypothetical protein J6C41_06835 [Oscillospiraceae bacterium]|nr:hypothetical protein [Oscillospiraceae bacterium]
MAGIEKAIELYTLMAQRCAREGLCPNQAQVYFEMADFMADCATAEEAMEKIKNSKYYTAPTGALIQDKLLSMKKAAEENNMSELAAIYSNKLHQIQQDETAIYDSGYEATAQAVKKKYTDTMDAFADIYRSYLRLSCCPPSDHIEMEDAIKDIRCGASKLNLPSSDFSALAVDAHFRKLIPCNDAGYDLFVKTVADILGGSNGIQDAMEEEGAQIRNEFELCFEKVAAAKDEIQEAGRINLAKTKATKVYVTAPDTLDGAYTYSESGV